MPDPESQAEHTRRMADDGAGNLEDVPGIESNISNEFDTLGTVIGDTSSLPSDAGIRPAGFFTDAHDAEIWLENGGLVVRDELGETIPLPWVFWLETFDDILQEYTYQVYIRDDSD